MKRIIIAIIIAILSASVLAGCAVQSPSPTIQSSASPTSPKNTVVIQNFAFNPTPLTVSVGDTVTWINQDSSTHIVKFPDFESTGLPQGSQYTHTFTAVGTYDYVCGIHSYMKGRIIVQ
jgi:plastocyanin